MKNFTLKNQNGEIHSSPLKLRTSAYSAFPIALLLNKLKGKEKKKVKKSTKNAYKISFCFYVKNGETESIDKVKQKIK